MTAGAIATRSQTQHSASYVMPRYVSGAGGRRLAGQIGGWRRDRYACRRNQCMCHGMGRTADRNGFESSRRGQGNDGLARHDDSQRTRHKGFSQPVVQRIRIGVHCRILRGSHVDDERIIRGAPLSGIDPAGSIGVGGVPTQPIHRLGGENNKSSRTDDAGGTSDICRLLCRIGNENMLGLQSNTVLS